MKVAMNLLMLPKFKTKLLNTMVDSIVNNINSILVHFTRHLENGLIFSRMLASFVYFQKKIY